MNTLTLIIDKEKSYIIFNMVYVGSGFTALIYVVLASKHNVKGSIYPHVAVAKLLEEL
jgi:hypothetical protein